MTDPWSFWQRQLAGERPPLPAEKGKPEWGFFLLRQSMFTRVPPEKRTIGGSRHNRTTNFNPVAIWQDEGRWRCVITYSDKTRYLEDPETIDEDIFSICCRAAIDHETYLAKVKELESARERVSPDQAVEHDAVDRSAQFG